MPDPQWYLDAKAEGRITEGPTAKLPVAGGSSSTSKPRKRDEADHLANILLAVRESGYGNPDAEFSFHPSRKWRFDYAWPAVKVAFEREGGDFVPVTCACGAVRTVFKSRHHDKDGLERDAEKYNAAACLGWIVIRATPRMLKNGMALSALLEAFKWRGKSTGTGE